MVEVPTHLRAKIYEQISKDLSPPSSLVHAKVGFSISVGGFLTLLLCGQMGFGLSSLADRSHNYLMEIGGHKGCLVLCGMLFAIVPVLLLRMLSTAIQYRILLRKHYSVIAGWMLAFGSILALKSQISLSVGTFVLWAAPAILSYFALGWLIHQLSITFSSLQKSNFA